MKNQKYPADIGKSGETDRYHPQQNIRDLTGKETEKVSHRSMGIRHCRLIITPAIHQ